MFSLPEHHRRRLRTSNPMERAVQQELKRRTVKVRVFPNEASLERLVSAVLVEIDDRWAADAKAYIKWECRMRDHANREFPDDRLLNLLLLREVRSRKTTTRPGAASMCRCCACWRPSIWVTCMLP